MDPISYVRFYHLNQLSPVEYQKLVTKLKTKKKIDYKEKKYFFNQKDNCNKILKKTKKKQNKIFNLRIHTILKT